MLLNKILGSYAITGINQDEERTTYKGVLDLKLNTEQQIEAKWLIEDVHEQFGVGTILDDTLVIDFFYYNSELEKFKGTVVYKCLNKTALDGFWIEEHGHPDFIGKEFATKH